MNMMFKWILMLSVGVVVCKEGVCPYGFYLEETLNKCQDCFQICTSVNVSEECGKYCEDIQGRSKTETNKECSQHKTLLIVVIVLVGFCACLLIKMSVYQLRRYCLDTRDSNTKFALGHRWTKTGQGV